MSERFLVVGAGISGVSACELLLNNNENVTLYDGNTELNQAELIKKNDFLSNVDIIVGDIEDSVIESFDKAVLSPGVPLDIDVVKRIKKAGITIWGEIELAYRYGKGRIVAITGTNGKTTTTALTGEIFKNYYDDVRVVGNIGIPYTKMVENSTDDTIFVAEISSFQLETIDEFKPEVTAILNITEDHLNRHHTMENYINAKKDITRNQDTSATCVLNYEDDELREFGETLDLNVVYFSSKRILKSGLYYNDGTIYLAKDGDSTKIIDVDDLTILGEHNFENAMSGIAMALAMDIPTDKIVEALKTFKAVEHRIEYVCERRGVKFYNDSKGTNPDAAIKGICAMNRPTFLIGGGYDKDSSYDEWVKCFDKRVKKLVLIGKTREKIAACCEKYNFKDYILAETLEEAMDICFNEAESGDAILLSPACASWGMFTNYEERGKVFKAHAREYKDA